MPRKLSVAVLAVAVLIVGAAPARDGDRPRMPPGQLSDINRGRAVTPSEAARIAQQQNGGGRVLAVEPDAGGYRVKLLKNGDVRIIHVPD